MSVSVKRWLTAGSETKINWGRELMASLVVFFVALPLCIAIAMASGAPPALGLVTGIIGGLMVGSFAGAPLQVSGPAAGLAVLIAEFIGTHGLALLGVAVLAAGAIQFVAGVLKLGRWFRAISPAVIQGMLAGIGVLIFADQFHALVDDKVVGTGLEKLVSIPAAVYKGVFPLEGDSHHIAAAVGLASLTTLVLWNLLRPKQLKAVPGPLVAVIVATILALSFDLQGVIKFVQVPTDLLNNLNMPTLGSFSALFSTSFLISVVAIAMIASAETLLCATAVDRLHTGPRTNYDQELAAQGVGNMLCGVAGALPMTGVIVRSSANIEAGARTRLPAILHGAWLLLLVLFLPNVLEMIPTTALAAILVHIGYKLLNIRGMRELWKVSRGEFLIYAVTLVMIVATDLLTGVMVGFGLAALRLLILFSRLEVVTEAGDGDRIDVHLAGAATFMSLPRFAQALEGLPRGSEVHLRFGGLAYIDHACLELLDAWEKQHRSTGGELVVEWHDLRARYKPSNTRVLSGTLAAEAFRASPGRAADMLVGDEHIEPMAALLSSGTHPIVPRSGESS